MGEPARARWGSRHASGVDGGGGAALARCRSVTLRRGECEWRRPERRGPEPAAVLRARDDPLPPRPGGFVLQPLLHGAAWQRGLLRGRRHLHVADRLGALPSALGENARHSDRRAAAEAGDARRGRQRRHPARARVDRLHLRRPAGHPPRPNRQAARRRRSGRRGLRPYPRPRARDPWRALGPARDRVPAVAPGAPSGAAGGGPQPWHCRSRAGRSWRCSRRRSREGAPSTAARSARSARAAFNVRELLSYVWQFYLPKLEFMQPTIGIPNYGFREVYIQSFYGDLASLEVEFPRFVTDLLGLATVLLLFAPLHRRRHASRRGQAPLAHDRVSAPHRPLLTRPPARDGVQQHAGQPGRSAVHGPLPVAAACRSWRSG